MVLDSRGLSPSWPELLVEIVLYHRDDERRAKGRAGASGHVDGSSVDERETSLRNLVCGGGVLNAKIRGKSGGC